MADGNLEKRPTDTAEHVKERPAVVPRVDVYENEKEYLLLADVPGVSRDNLSINLDQDELLLEAHRTDGDEATLMAAEFRSLDYRRKFALPQGVDRASVSAELRNGILRLSLPKAEAHRPRRIEIKAG
jgi:HSP20 family molecular chaperone IbpA